MAGLLLRGEHLLVGADPGVGRAALRLGRRVLVVQCLEVLLRLELDGIELVHGLLEQAVGARLVAIRHARLPGRGGVQWDLLQQQPDGLGDHHALLGELHKAAAFEPERLYDGAPLKVAHRRVGTQHLVAHHLHLLAQLLEARGDLGQVLILGAHACQPLLHRLDLGLQLALAPLDLGERLLAGADRLEMQPRGRDKVVVPQLGSVQALVQQRDFWQDVGQVVAVVAAPSTQRLTRLLQLAGRLGVGRDVCLL